MLTTILKSIETNVFIAITSSSITLSVPEIALNAIQLAGATAYGLSVGDKVIYEIVLQK